MFVELVLEGDDDDVLAPKLPFAELGAEEAELVFVEFAFVLALMFVLLLFAVVLVDRSAETTTGVVLDVVVEAVVPVSVEVDRVE